MEGESHPFHVTVMEGESHPSSPWHVPSDGHWLEDDGSAQEQVCGVAAVENNTT